eukprot:g50414.t1
MLTDPEAPAEGENVFKASDPGALGSPSYSSSSPANAPVLKASAPGANGSPSGSTAEEQTQEQSVQLQSTDHHTEGEERHAEQEKRLKEHIDSSQEDQNVLHRPRVIFHQVYERRRPGASKPCGLTMPVFLVRLLWLALLPPLVYYAIRVADQVDRARNSPSISVSVNTLTEAHLPIVRLCKVVETEGERPDLQVTKCVVLPNGFEAGALQVDCDPSAMPALYGTTHMRITSLVHMGCHDLKFPSLEPPKTVEWQLMLDLVSSPGILFAFFLTQQQAYRLDSGVLFAEFAIDRTEVAVPLSFHNAGLFMRYREMQRCNLDKILMFASLRATVEQQYLSYTTSDAIGAMGGAMSLAAMAHRILLPMVCALFGWRVASESAYWHTGVVFVSPDTAEGDTQGNHPPKDLSSVFEEIAQKAQEQFELGGGEQTPKRPPISIPEDLELVSVLDDAKDNIMRDMHKNRDYYY